MEDNRYYKVYSEHLRAKYGEKVYKLPVSLELTCPNRDGCVGRGGCIFCGEEGGSFENRPNHLAVAEQLAQNRELISKKYKAKKFIAFFQNFTNTYMDIDEFKLCVSEALEEDVVGISISTRPDCVGEEYLKFLKELEKEHGVEITIELGLQSVNYRTLEKINRGHGLAEFIDAMARINSYGFNSCVHMILNLPWDDMSDVVEGARILSALKVKEVKLHALYIVKGTAIGNMYESHEFEMVAKAEYIERVIAFLENLDPDIAIQRIIGRAPEENTLFVNWDTSWWKIKDEILETMESRGSYQGKRFDYLNGRALKKFR
jgi:uncharacterized protein